jgi:hypothetical protein
LTARIASDSLAGMRRARIGTGAVVAAVALALAAATVMARPASPPTAIVSLGDSFISGEGGGSYGASAENGCDRSVMAPIRSAPIEVDEKVTSPVRARRR